MSLDQIAANALSHNGYHDGQGYDEPTPWNGWQNNYAWCAVFACAMARDAGYSLPNWGVAAGGFAYVPTGWYNAVKLGATASSYEGRPGDFVIFNWNGDGQPFGASSHIEVVTGYQGGVLYSCGGNSGPSNVDGFRGAGGVHRHAWSAPVGQGNSLIQGIIRVDKIATGQPTEPVPPPTPPVVVKRNGQRFDGWPEIMSGSKDPGPWNSAPDKAHPVNALQNSLNIINRHEASTDRLRLDPDGEFGPATDAAVRALQAHYGRTVDGDVGPDTWTLVAFLLTLMGR